MKRTIATILITALVTIGPTLGFAAGTTGGFVNITAIDVRTDNTWLITVSSNASNSPSCVTGSSTPVLNRFSGLTTTEGGKATLHFAEAVFLSGKTVRVDGTGACNEYAGIESAYRLYAAQ